MRKNKLRICGLIVALALLAGAPALAQISFQGTVVSSKTIAVNAPFGGIVDGDLHYKEAYYYVRQALSE